MRCTCIYMYESVYVYLSMLSYARVFLFLIALFLISEYTVLNYVWVCVFLYDSESVYVCTCRDTCLGITGSRARMWSGDECFQMPFCQCVGGAAYKWHVFYCGGQGVWGEITLGVYMCVCVYERRSMCVLDIPCANLQSWLCLCITNSCQISFLQPMHLFQCIVLFSTYIWQWENNPFHTIPLYMELLLLTWCLWHDIFSTTLLYNTNIDSRRFSAYWFLELNSNMWKSTELVTLYLNWLWASMEVTKHRSQHKTLCK